MSDLGTMVQDLLIDTDEVDAATERNRLRHKIAQAIASHQGRRYHFLVSRWELALKDEGGSYDLSETVPQVSSIIGEKAWLLIGGNRNDRARVFRKPFRRLEDLLTGTAIAANYPNEFSLHGSEILIYPPASGEHILTGWGKAKAEAPKPEYDNTAGAWAYPDDSFTNVWFQEGYELIREYACWLLFSGPLADKSRGNDAKERYTMIERDILLTGEEMQFMETMGSS